MADIKQQFIHVFTKRVAITTELTDEQMNTSIYDLGADSLDTVELTIAVEDTFGIELPDSEVFVKPDASYAGQEPLRLSTPNDWIKHIEGKVNGKDT